MKLQLGGSVDLGATAPPESGLEEVQSEGEAGEESREEAQSPPLTSAAVARLRSTARQMLEEMGTNQNQK